MILYLFDIDGTLLRAHRAGGRAFDEVFARHHGLVRASEGFKFGGRTDPSIFDEIFAAKLGRPPRDAERDAFIEAYVPLLRGYIAESGVTVFASVVDTLRWLAARPEVVLGVATGNVRGGAEAKLAAAGLDGYFALGGYACDSPVRAELVAAGIARGRARGDIDEVVVIGDTPHDITAARACGAVALAVTTGSFSAEALADADVVFDGLGELPAWHAARYGDRFAAITASVAPTVPADR